MPPPDGRPPRVTVVVPVLDQARWIGGALGSLLGQGYPDLEVIVADGGSTDGTVDVIRRHAHRLAAWWTGPDAGQADAVERGFDRATGEVLGWLNADDRLLPGALARVGEAFRDRRVEAVCGWSVVIDEEGRRIGLEVHPQPTRETLRLRPRLQQETVYWRREVRERVGRLDPSLHLCFDRDYWLRMAEAGVVPRLVRAFQGAFRRHPGQKGARRREEARAEERRILERVHGRGADPDALRRRLPVGWRWRRWALRRAARLGLLRPPPLDAD